MITFRNGCAIAAVALALPMTAISPGQAAPLAPSQSVVAAHTESANSLLTEVQWRRYGYRGYGYRRGWGGGAGLGLGLAAGALLGGAIAAGSNPYYYGPGYYPAPAPVVVEPGGDAVAYCMQRFKSYDPGSGTYLGYDGYRHPCP